MKDVIYNTTTTHFGFIDRLKILIGGKAVTKVEITTNNDVIYVKETDSRTFVVYPDWINRIIKRKSPGGFDVMTCGGTTMTTYNDKLTK